MGVSFFIHSIAVACRSFSTKTCNSSKTARYKAKAKANPREPRIPWTDEQKDILARARCGTSLFITGSAGTGKTALLKTIITDLKQVHGRSKVFVTASTGLAACALGGQTLHSFSGIGIADSNQETLLEKVLTNGHACRRWKKAEALIIEEISMINADTFESLEYIARMIRESDEVWGGMQLIVCGDFLQLPPVIKEKKKNRKVYAFEADCWDKSFALQVELTQVFRQADTRLIKLLQGIRKGVNDAEDLKLLDQACSWSEIDPLAVRLYPRTEDVKNVNEEKMKSLGEPVFTYEAADGGPEFQKKQLNHGIAPENLKLCKGARVMLIANLNIWNKLCNGATGTVTQFVEGKNGIVAKLCPHNLLPVVKFDSGQEFVIEPYTFDILDGDTVVACRFQMPLLLAWAVSVHKSQGMTLDCVHTDLSKAFGDGMVYVVLSRVRTLDGLYLAGFTASKIKANPKVLQFYERLTGAGKNEEGNEEVDDVVNKNEEGSSGSADELYFVSVKGRKYNVVKKIEEGSVANDPYRASAKGRKNDVFNKNEEGSGFVADDSCRERSRRGEFSFYQRGRVQFLSKRYKK